jgi:excisionase family DNA binding protein
VDDYYSVKEFADKLGLTAQGVHALMKAGTINFQRAGHLFMIPKGELAKAESRKGKGRPKGT